MAGFLEDPVSAGAMSLGLRLLSTPGKFGQALGTAGLGAMNDMDRARVLQTAEKDRALQAQIMQMQVQQMVEKQRQQAEAQKRQQGIEGAYRGALEMPAQQALAQGGGPTLGNAQAMQGMAPRINQQKLIEALSQIDPMMAAQMLTPKERKYEKVGSSLLDVTDGVKEAYREPEKAASLPTSVEEYLYAQQNPAYADWDLRRKKAGATNIGLPKIDIKVGEGLAKEIGPMIAASHDAAAGAIPAIENSDRIISAIESGKVMAGPFASSRLKVAQVADLIGVTGADTKEKIEKTRQVIQGLAQSTLNARSQLKGQGQVSDYEGKLLARASSGEIDDMTPEEIKTIAQLNKKLSGQLVKRHQSMMERARNQPGLQGMTEMFDIPTPVQAPPSTDGQVMRFDAKGNPVK